MEESSLSPANTFVVKDSIGVCIIAGIIFLAMFISAVVYTNSSKTSEYADVKIAYVTIIPSIIFFVKAFRNKPIIEINHLGIFFSGELVTDWNNFISARYAQEEITLSISDNFVLLIEYFKPEMPTSYISKIKLPSTLNKSEEEIIEAIEEHQKLVTAKL